MCGMSSQDFKETPTPALLQQAVALARNGPVLQSEDYWARIRARHFRAGKDVFEAAVELCSGPDPISRSVGADILAQLGVLDGEYPFAAAPLRRDSLRLARRAEARASAHARASEG